MIPLPVSGLAVVLHPPTGAEDILLLEAAALDVRVAVSLLERCAAAADGSPIAWPALAMTDIDTAVLRLRQRVVGDVIRAEVRCRAGDCRARIDIVFSIEEFLRHHQPRAARIEPTADGWFRLPGSDVEFRAPCAADQMAIALEAHPERALARRCIRRPDAPPRLRRRIESAMDAMAPSLFSELEGVCPECAASVAIDFDPLVYTLRELRSRAAYVYQDVLAIAHRTHWSEADILALPTARRARYAELSHGAVS